MKIRFYLCFISLIISSKIIYSQSSSLKKLPLNIAYFGDNGFHPGLKLGTSFLILSKEKSKPYRRKKLQTKYGDKRTRKDLFLDYNIGLYSHPNNHIGVFTSLGATYLRTKLRKNRQKGLSFELGYLRRFNTFLTYTLDENQQIKKVILAGNNALTVALSPIFAKEYIQQNSSFRLYLKPMLQMISYNHSLFPNVSIEIGVALNIHPKASSI